MGLNISHGTFDRSYSTFHKFRTIVAHLSGFPPLELMEGFYQNGDAMNDPFFMLKNEFRISKIKERLPIKWDLFQHHPISELLYHSDCDGKISYGKAKKIGDHIRSLVEKLPEEWKDWEGIFVQFSDGCDRAYSEKKPLIFR